VPKDIKPDEYVQFLYSLIRTQFDSMILVTGGTGLLGAQLLFDLAKSGKKVRALKRATSSLATVQLLFLGQEQLLNNIEWIDGDVQDYFSIRNAMNGVSEVYHCAAMVSFFPQDRKEMMKINAEGTAHMVNAAIEEGVKKFCYVSSVAALGRIDEDKIIDETFIWKASKNNSNYAISKYSGEREVWRAVEEGLNAVIVNPTIILGAGDWKTSSAQMFGQMWKGFKFYSEGINGFVDATDVTKCMLALMEKGSFHQRFIIVSENLSYHRVFDMIADRFGKPRPSIKVNRILSNIGWRLEWLRTLILQNQPLITKETAHNSQLRWYYSNEKIKKELAIEFMPVKDSVERVANLFLKMHS
jgi:dihydroflavonol-4-reductase